MNIGSQGENGWQSLVLRLCTWGSQSKGLGGLGLPASAVRLPPRSHLLKPQKTYSCSWHSGSHASTSYQEAERGRWFSQALRV